MLAEAVFACFISCLLLSAVLSSLCLASALVAKYDGAVKRERIKREKFLERIGAGFSAFGAIEAEKETAGDNENNIDKSIR